MDRKRKLYERMKKHRISTIDVKIHLEEAGLNIPERTLQNYLDQDMVHSKKERVKLVEKAINKIIANKKELVNDLKTMVLC